MTGKSDRNAIFVQLLTLQYIMTNKPPKLTPLQKAQILGDWPGGVRTIPDSNCPWRHAVLVNRDDLKLSGVIQRRGMTRQNLHGAEDLAGVLLNLPKADNAPGAVERMLQANAILRCVPWPDPFDETVHQVRCGDARDLSWLSNESIHLVVTSPPYWTLKKYEPRKAQLGEIADYEAFLAELDKVWAECARVLVLGGWICCVVGDVCIPRKKTGRHHIMPLHADIQSRSRRLGLDCLTPILWHKIANGATEAAGNGAGFYGKPYQPGAIIKNDVEYILSLRKGGNYRSPTTVQRALSMLTKDEMQSGDAFGLGGHKGGVEKEGAPGAIPRRAGRAPDQDVFLCWRYYLGPVLGDRINLGRCNPKWPK